DIHPDTLAAILKHHEYSDGSGFPQGVAVEDIPTMAAVLAIAEAYCSLTSPYNEEHAVSPHDAVLTIMNHQPPLFPPDVLREFLSCMAIYPAGTFVLLNNGLRCVVISANTDHPLRPRLLALYDADNIPVKPYHLNLTDAKNIEMYIEKTVSVELDKKPLEEIIKV
ncbi:MAG: HD domain-containing phosphohydrolase, partial [bacterium]